MDFANIIHLKPQAWHKIQHSFGVSDKVYETQSAKRQAVRFNKL